MKKLWITTCFCALVVGLACVFFLMLFPVRYREYIEEISNKYNLDLSLVLSVINIESGWDEKAVSSSGAVGLMQVMSATAKEVAQKLEMENYEDRDLYEGKINIEIGCFYLRYLIDLFGGNEKLALCAYNAGPNKVKEWQSNIDYWDGKDFIKIPYKETEKYVNKAKLNKKMYKFILQL